MPPDDENASRDRGILSSGSAHELVALARELRDLVERFEHDWQERGTVTSDLAEQLHALLKRAQYICSRSE